MATATAKADAAGGFHARADPLTCVALPVGGQSCNMKHGSGFDHSDAAAQSTDTTWTAMAYLATVTGTRPSFSKPFQSQRLRPQ